MNSTLIEIEKILGFELPSELKNFYRIITTAKNTMYILDGRGLSKHWLGEADYFFVKPNELNSKDRDQYYLKDNIVKEDGNILNAINSIISYSSLRYWGAEKVFCFAWTNQVPEKDTGLAYVFNDDGTVDGIYAHSLNWVEDKVLIAKKLSDIIDFDNISTDPGVVKFNDSIAKNRKSYKQLFSGQFEIIDLESVDDVKDYQYLLGLCKSLSKEEFSPKIVELSEVDNIRMVRLEYRGKIFSMELQGDTDYVDLKILDLVNECLLSTGYKYRKFIAFRESSFGAEVGIAFLSKTGLRSLISLSNIEIIKE